MRTVSAAIFVLTWLGLLIGLLGVSPCRAFTLAPPPESLAGLVPGVNGLGDAVGMHGNFDVCLPGVAEYYAGGESASKAYQWVVGDVLGRPGLTVETSLGSGQISLVMVDMFPGIRTSRGLSVLQPENAAVALYGFPDFAYEMTMVDPPVRELFYLDHGLIVLMRELPGRPNWTIVKLIVTYPLYLKNAVALRTRESLVNGHIVDITDSYRVWARMALP